MIARSILLGTVVLLGLQAPPADAVSSRWAPAGQLTGSSICAVAVSPGFPGDRTIWAGSPGNGLFVSGDRAMSWHALPIPNASAGTCEIKFSPEYSIDHTVIAVSDQAYITHDLGATWAPLSLPLAPSLVAFSPSFLTDHVVIAVGNAGPMYRSSDSGLTWVQVANWQEGLSADAHFIATSLLVRPDGSALLGTGDGIYRSSDLGKTWSWENDGFPVVRDRNATTGQSFQRVPQVAGIAARQSTVYVALRDTVSATVYRSVNGGSAWTRVGPRIAAVPSDLASAHGVSGQVLLLATNNRGVLASRDGGITWSGYSTGLSDRDVVALVVAPDGGTVVAGAAFDGVFTRTLSDSRWFLGFSGMPQTDPAGALIDPAPNRRSVVFAGTLSGVFRSSNNGGTWWSDDQGLPGERSVFTFVAMRHPKGKFTLLAGTSNGLYRSPNGQGVWRQIGSRLMRGLAVGSVAQWTARNVGMLAAGSENGLFESSDGGVSWRMLVRGDMTVEELQFVRVGAGLGLFALCAGRLLLYRGRHESIVSRGLDQQPILSFIVASSTPTTIFVATSTALYLLSKGRARRLMSFPAPVSPVLKILGGRTVLVGAGRAMLFGPIDGGRLQTAKVPGNGRIAAIAPAGPRNALVSFESGGVWHFRV